MAALDAIALPRLDPWQLLGLESYFIESMPAGGCGPVLLTYALPGRVVSIGRYHLYGGPAERAGVIAYRRFTGGRIVGAGEGWLGAALILPTRSSLLREQDTNLKPDQVMNRYVRGALNGLRALGVDCFYPGRDAVTAARREIAMCSFEIGAGGAMLFELMLAVERGMDDLIRDLEGFDPSGSLTSAMYDRDNATALARELKRNPSFDEITAAIRSGYADLLGEIRRRDLTRGERSQADQRGAALRASRWLNDRRPEPDLDKASVSAGQLGPVEARLRLDGDGAIERLVLGGSFLANSPGIHRFEAGVVGNQLDFATVSALAMRTFGDGSNYILGIGELANLVKLVVKAA